MLDHPSTSRECSYSLWLLKKLLAEIEEHPTSEDSFIACNMNNSCNLALAPKKALNRCFCKDVAGCSSLSLRQVGRVSPLRAARLQQNGAQRTDAPYLAAEYPPVPYPVSCLVLICPAT